MRRNLIKNEKKKNSLKKFGLCEKAARKNVGKTLHFLPWIILGNSKALGACRARHPTDRKLSRKNEINKWQKCFEKEKIVNELFDEIFEIQSFDFFQ